MNRSDGILWFSCKCSRLKFLGARWALRLLRVSLWGSIHQCRCSSRIWSTSAGLLLAKNSSACNSIRLSWNVCNHRFEFTYWIRFRVDYLIFSFLVGWMAMLMFPMEGYSSHTQNSFAMRLEIFIVWFAVLRLHLASGACKIRSGIRLRLRLQARDLIFAVYWWI